jgi:hypothetical protein
VAASGVTTILETFRSPDAYRIERSDVPGILRRTAARFFLALVPAGLLAIALYPSGENYAFDLRVFWEAGAAFVDGRSPYPEQSAAVIATKQNFLYPAPIAALFAPLSALPLSVAAALFSIVVLGAALLMLRVLGVRDWRCYGAVCLGFPLVFSVGLGTISTLLGLALAALWRWRDRTIVAALLLAFLVVSKLFLWPLAAWLLLTRRYRTVALAAAIAVAASLIAWWRVGFETLAEYPDLLRMVAAVEQADSFSPTALGIALGLPANAAQLASLALGLGLLVWAGMHERTRTDDRRLLVVVLGVALICSPIVWGHYLVLLFVPLALVYPRFSPLWLATAWMTPDNLQYGYNHGFETGGLIATAAGLAVIGTILWHTGRSGPAPASPSVRYLHFPLRAHNARLAEGWGRTTRSPGEAEAAKRFRCLP